MRIWSLTSWACVELLPWDGFALTQSCHSEACSPKLQAHSFRGTDWLQLSSSLTPAPPQLQLWISYNPARKLFGVTCLCQILLLTSLLSHPLFYHTLNCKMMSRVMSQNRIWSLSISYGLQEWTGLLLVSHQPGTDFLPIGLLFSFLNNRCS